MKKKMKRKIKLRKVSKVIITIFILVTGLQLYYDLALLGMTNDKTPFDDAMLCLGWIWLIYGQMITLHFVWEN